MMIATLRRNSKDFFISVIKLFHHITSLFSGIIPAFNTILLHIEKDLVTVVMTITGLLYFSQLSFYFPLLFLLISIIYILVYFWRHIPIELVSYIWFMINSGIFVLFLLGFYNVFFIGLPNPIHLQDLSDFSYWRYFALLFFTLLGFISYFFIITYPSDFGSSIVHILSFPYLKENVRIILSSWDYSLLGDFSIKLTDILLSSKSIRRLFFLCHFIFFYVVRFIFILLFMNFVFLHGDLRINLYLLPLSFLIWILRFFEYYYFSSIKAYIRYLRQIICVTTTENIPLSDDGFIVVSQLYYHITSYGLEEGFTDGNIVFTLWLEYMDLYVYLLKYKTKVKYLSICFLLINIIGWGYIITSDQEIQHVGWGVFSIFTRRFSSTAKLYDREAHRLRERYQGRLKEQTKGSFSQGHPIYGEKKDGEFMAQGALTHGEGSKEHPSTPLGNESPEAKPTKAIPFDKPVPIPSSEIDPRPMPTTDRLLNDPIVKAKLDALNKTLPSSKE